jgi:hypothetical protein
LTALDPERDIGGHRQAIPPMLQQSLAARPDRLGKAREVAQIGAVLGRDFTYSLLRAVGGVDDPALQSALDRLAEANRSIRPKGDVQPRARQHRSKLRRGGSFVVFVLRDRHWWCAIDPNPSTRQSQRHFLTSAQLESASLPNACSPDIFWTIR